MVEYEKNNGGLEFGMINVKRMDEMTGKYKGIVECQNHELKRE